MQLFQFLVDGNAQCLEDLGGRMTAVGTGAAPGSRLARDGSHQVEGGLEGLLLAERDDAARVLAGQMVFTKLEDHMGQLFLGDSREPLRGGLPGGGVVPQIEGTVDLEAESAFPIGQLVGTPTEIEQNAIDRSETQIGQNARKKGVRGVNDVDVGTRNAGGGKIHHPGIPVKSDQPSGGTNPLQNRPAVPASSQGPIDHRETWGKFENLENFPQQDWHVCRAGRAGRFGERGRTGRLGRHTTIEIQTRVKCQTARRLAAA